MSTPLAARRLATLGLILTALALLILTALLLMPGQEGPGRIPHLDKVFHFTGFFGLVLPFAVARPRWALVAALVAAGYGGAIELIQPSVGRGAEWGDALANLLGALSGALAGRRLHPVMMAWLSRPQGDPGTTARSPASPLRTRPE